MRCHRRHHARTVIRVHHHHVVGCLLAGLLLLATHCDSAVILTYSIQRHGARNALPKTLLLKETQSLGGTTLLPLGLRLCYNAGSDFRARYLDPATCGTTCLTATGSTDTTYGVINLGAGFNNYNTWVRSSYLDRALLSAYAYVSGIFPANATLAALNPAVGIPTGQQEVPVYTTNDVDDCLIRTYTKCPNYDQKLLAWYQSPEFQSKAQSSQPVRDAIKQVSPNLDTSLANWWNVYDGINVYRTYGVGDPQPTIDNGTWADAQALAWWLETAKMKSSLIGNLLGGPLLGDMLRFMDGAQSAVQALQPNYYKLLSVSSHYNVQLGVLNALALDQYPPAVAALNWLDATLPQLASVVVFELHSSTPVPAAGGSPLVLAVRLVVQQGPGEPYVTVPMPCESPGDTASLLAGPGACSWDAFRALVGPRALNTTAAWCSACGNTDAAPCAVANANAQLAALQSAQGGPDDTVSKNKYVTAVAVGVVVTFVGTTLLCVGAFMLYLAKTRRSGETHALTSFKSVEL